MEEFPCTSSPYTQNQDYDFIRWKSGKRVDPRPLSILELFEDIYTNNKDFLKKLFDGEHEELFNKIAIAMKKKKKTKKMKTMTRSMSMHAIGSRGFDDDEINDGGVKLERFKVRRPNVIVTGSDNGGSGGGLVIEGQAN